ncbi:MAG: Ppx/GppA phosphatase family protein [bacterium]|nr:Ppx/GppA phosphatase family protein [bacterium]
MGIIMKAAIDIGTNTVLLLIANPSQPPLTSRGGVPPLGVRGGQGELAIIYDEVRITRLGEQLHTTGRFSEQAMQRTFSALKEYKKICDEKKVSEIRAVGTAAFRKAENAVAFVQRVQKETGIKIKIISGEEEAALAYSSVKRDFGGEVMALDIGGGSTEIISETTSISFPLGCVELTEKFFKLDPVTREEVERVYKMIDNILNKNVGATPCGCPNKEGGHGDPPLQHLIALAGTATTLSAINQKMKTWDPKKIQGSVIKKEALEKIIRTLVSKTVEERKKIIGMVPERSDLLLSGAMILQKVMERLGVDKVTVSDRGVRYGLLYAPSLASPSL